MTETEKKRKKSGLKTRLLLAFCFTSIIPLVIINIFSYHNTSSIVRDNVQELTYANLLQTASSLDVWLESYEDILFQIYTNDDIVELIDNINNDENVSVNRNALRRKLHGLFYTKEYIKCISVLTENDTLVFYDLLTGSSTRNSWIDNMDMSRNELYEIISADNDTHIFSTQKTMKFGTEDHYLFHIGHRIIDYRDVEKQLGVVVVSIDEKLLGSVCTSEDNPKDSFNFMVDQKGRLVSYPDKKLLSTKAVSWNEDIEKRKEAYEKFIIGQNVFSGKHLSASVVYDENFGCDIINVSSQEEVVKRLDVQSRLFAFVLTISVSALVVMIFILTNRLTSSLKKMVPVMELAGDGVLDIQVELDKAMPDEVESIAREFNRMLERLADSLKNEREAGERQRRAEIAALEAQINPHFLYNTLDTINWMAIDREEYEISNSIGALAHILRYGIDNSNGIVTIKEETDWLKQYLFLQQTRLKNTFQCEIHVEPELFAYRIHKLLLQPFVENAILHGFEGLDRVHVLKIEIADTGESLRIEIFDNGKGIPEAITAQMNQGIFPKSSEKNHIGMENAINRIHMYYGEAGQVRIESSYGEWTKASLLIPKIPDSGTRRPEDII